MLAKLAEKPGEQLKFWSTANLYAEKKDEEGSDEQQSGKKRKHDDQGGKGDGSRKKKSHSGSIKESMGKLPKGKVQQETPTKSLYQVNSICTKEKYMVLSKFLRKVPCMWFEINRLN